MVEGMVLCPPRWGCFMKVFDQVLLGIIAAALCNYLRPLLISQIRLFYQLQLGILYNKHAYIFCNVADANGGIGRLSQLTELGRESLDKTLTQDGDSSPYFATIHQILSSLGMKFLIQPKNSAKEAA